MKRIFSLLIGVGLILTTILLYVFLPPFLGKVDLVGNLQFFNRCRTTSKQLGDLTDNQGLFIGRLIDTIYKKDRIFILIESLEGIKHPFMVIPREMGDTIFSDYFHSSYGLFRLKHLDLSFCGRPNMFSTQLVKNTQRIGNTYSETREILENFKNSGQIVWAYVADDQNNFVFDLSGTIFLHQLDFITPKP